MTKLDYKLEIYLPAEFDVKDAFHLDLVSKLTREFGGATICQNNVGTWLEESNKSIPQSKRKICFDKVSILRIYTTESFFRTGTRATVFFETIEAIKEHFNQTCVAFTLNDAMEFY